MNDFTTSLLTRKENKALQLATVASVPVMSLSHPPETVYFLVVYRELPSPSSAQAVWATHVSSCRLCCTRTISGSSTARNPATRQSTVSGWNTSKGSIGEGLSGLGCAGEGAWGEGLGGGSAMECCVCRCVGVDRFNTAVKTVI